MTNGLLAAIAFAVIAALFLCWRMRAKFIHNLVRELREEREQDEFSRRAGGVATTGRSTPHRSAKSRGPKRFNEDHPHWGRYPTKELLAEGRKRLGLRD